VSCVKLFLVLAMILFWRVKMSSTLPESEARLEKLGFKKSRANEWIYSYAGRGGFRLKLKLLQDGALKGALYPAWSFISPSKVAYKNVQELERILGAYMKLDEVKTPSLGEKLIQRLAKGKKTRA